MAEILVVPGTLRGYRWWAPTSQPDRLRSLTQGYKWRLDSNRAECIHNPPVPQAQCECGFWAYLTPSHALNHYRLDDSWFSYAGSVVFGVIEAWGRVILHERGFRAEKARIVARLIHQVELAPWLPDSYGDTRVFFQAREMIEAFPPMSIDELLVPDLPAMESMP